MAEIGVKITGTGSYLPERVLTNDDLEHMVETSDEWIRTRTGIIERRIAADDEPTSALGAKAAERALEAAGLTAADVELIIVATITPDKPFPNTACFVQKRIGAWGATCFSLEAACSGFVYALDVGAAMLKQGNFKNALVIGAEKMSSLVDWQDRTTCVLFGDGAGAAVIQPCAPDECCYLGATMGSDGRHTDLLHVPAGGSQMPISKEVLARGDHFLKMSGPGVFKLAVNTMVSATNAILSKTGIHADQIRWLIPHQANIRIINSVAKRLDLPEERVYVNLHRIGNSSAATIPVALDELVRDGKIASGDYIVLVAFGGGLTWGASIIRW